MEVPPAKQIAAEDLVRVRPVSAVRVDGFVVYVANLRWYHKTGELAANPKVELCYLDDHHNLVRITGVAEVLTDQQIWDNNPLLRNYLGTLDNPELIIYRIAESRALHGRMGSKILRSAVRFSKLCVIWFRHA